MEGVLALLILHGIYDGQCVHISSRLHLVLWSSFEVLVFQAPDCIDPRMRQLHLKHDILGFRAHLVLQRFHNVHLCVLKNIISYTPILARAKTYE